MARLQFAALTPPVDPIDCRGTPTSHRFVVDADGGERLGVRAAADGFVWIRMVAETDADVATTYPTAPTLPAAVAGTPYSQSIPTMLGIGTVGGNRQTVLPINGADPRPHRWRGPTGQYLRRNERFVQLCPALDPDGERVATVAVVQAPGLVLATGPTPSVETSTTR